MLKKGKAFYTRRIRGGGFWDNIMGIGKAVGSVANTGANAIAEIPITGKTANQVKEDLNNLINECGAQGDAGYNARQELLQKNLNFYSWIMANVVLKNKWDYPPAGPTSTDRQAFQDQKLKYIFQAIGEKKTSATGETVPYPLGSHGNIQQTALAARTVASKALDVKRAVTTGYFNNKPLMEQPAKI